MAPRAGDCGREWVRELSVGQARLGGSVNEEGRGRRRKMERERDRGSPARRKFTANYFLPLAYASYIPLRLPGRELKPADGASRVSERETR